MISRGDAQALTGISIAAEFAPMSPLLPALSGLEIARALMLAGFRLSDRGTGPLILDRGWRTVSVPQSEAVGDGELARVLAAAGISPSEFLVLVDRRQVGGAGKVS